VVVEAARLLWYSCSLHEKKHPKYLNKRYELEGKTLNSGKPQIKIKPPQQK
jgi:hypothetical protein